MRYLIDSANIKDIEYLMRTGCFDGVTTNPSLVAKEGGGRTNPFGGTLFEEYIDFIRPIHKHLSSLPSKPLGALPHLSVEVVTLNRKEMFEQAQQLKLEFNKGVDLAIKIPVHFLDVIKELADRGFAVNATAIMTTAQAELAEQAGARYISFFYNRIKDGGGNPLEEASKFCGFRKSGTEVIFGSIRNAADIQAIREASAAVNAVLPTISMKVFTEMLTHPQTAKAIQEFQENIEKWHS